MENKEIKAIGTVAAALEQLDKEAIQRVLSWAASKFGAKLDVTTNISDHIKHANTSNESVGTFASFADLFDAANPTNDKEKMLVSGFWLQEIEGAKEWASQPANDALKNLGHPISNVTRTLTELQELKPTQIMQTQKSGKTQQARKLYKVTGEGIKVVRRLLAGASSDEK
jgi:hypothetical protein